MELKRLRRETVYKGRIIDLLVDEVEYPSGNRTVREVAHHPGGAATVALRENGVMVLVDQLRYPLEKHILEIPAGKLAPGEDPAVCAVRELEEETGWTAGSVQKLCSVYTSPGFCDEELHIFLARDIQLSPEGHRREEGEFTMSVREMAMDDVLHRILTGEIKDAKTIIGVLLADRLMREETGTAGS